jgi:hypothetical protein
MAELRQGLTDKEWGGVPTGNHLGTLPGASLTRKELINKMVIDPTLGGNPRQRKMFCC